jgi:hypothetical protein
MMMMLMEGKENANSNKVLGALGRSQKAFGFGCTL